MLVWFLFFLAWEQTNGQQCGTGKKIPYMLSNCPFHFCMPIKDSNGEDFLVLQIQLT